MSKIDLLGKLDLMIKNGHNVLIFNVCGSKNEICVLIANILNMDPSVFYILSIEIGCFIFICSAIVHDCIYDDTDKKIISKTKPKIVTNKRKKSDEIAAYQEEIFLLSMQLETLMKYVETINKRIELEFTTSQTQSSAIPQY